MKKILFLITLLSISVLTFAQSLSLSGNVKGATSGKVYLQKFIDRYFENVDSANIENGKFKFNSKVELPEVYGLSLDQSGNSYLVFLDKGNITVDLDSARNYSNSVTKGSELQDLYLDYRKNARSINISDFIKSHPKSLVAVYALYRDYSYRMSTEDIKSNLSLLDKSLQETPYAGILKDLLNTYQVVKIGNRAPNFHITDINGKNVQLKDYIGKGYLLLDFWASWCGPCRKENPNVVKTFRTFKDKGFDILAVSLDKSRDAWVKAIHDDKLNYNHVSELKYWNSEAAKLYGVRSIPGNFLIDKNGIIVAKNLRGDQLSEVLEQLLDKK